MGLTGRNASIQGSTCVLIGKKGDAPEIPQTELSGKKLAGSLSSNNADTSKAETILDESVTQFFLSELNLRTAWSETRIRFTKPSPYLTAFSAGPTLFPRSLCFIEFDQEISGELKNRIVRVKSSSVTARDAKQPWKDISISGTVSTNYIFTTALANNLVPFGLNGSHMVILPFAYDSTGVPTLLTPEGLEDKGDLGTAKWFMAAFSEWDKNKTERSKNMNFNQRLNFQNDLVKYNFANKYAVIYTTSGTNAVATVIDRCEFELPFIANAVTYYTTTNNKEDALYLCAYFNSGIANQLIKPFQAQGNFGARHITKKILEIPLPVYDSGISIHQEIVALAQKATDKVAAYIAAQNFDRYGNHMDARECGRFRNQVRAHIYDEMQEIDKRIKQLLNL